MTRILTSANCSFYDEKFGIQCASLPLTSHNIQLHNERYHNNNYHQQQEGEGGDKIRQISRGLVGSRPSQSHSKESFQQKTNRTWLVFSSALLIVFLVLGQPPHDSKTVASLTSLNSRNNNRSQNVWNASDARGGGLVGAAA